MYNEDKLAVLYSVGYPEPNESHFRSTDIWLTGADSNQYLTTGWAGRFLSTTYENFPIGYPNATMPDPLAIQIGSMISTVFMGPGGFTAMATPTDIDFYGLINGNYRSGSGFTDGYGTHLSAHGCATNQQICRS